MNLPWKYLLDQMEIQTENNVKKAVTLSLYHDSSLYTLSLIYPGLLPYYTRYHPLHLSFMDGYTNLDSSGGAKQGDRVSVEILLVSSKQTLANTWLVDILKLHPKGSARYIAIFPNGMTPFNSKGIDARIAAYSTLAKNIGSEVALASTKTDVTTAYNNLLAARATQTNAKTSTKDTSGTLNDLRVAAMEMQYRNLGGIMDTFFDTREVLCPLLFDLVTLRINPQTLFTGNLVGSMKKAVLANTFKATDTVDVKATQITRLYLSTTIGGIDSTPIKVPANIKTTINVADFGVTDYTAHRFLTIVNQAVVAGKYSITLQ